MAASVVVVFGADVVVVVDSSVIIVVPSVVAGCIVVELQLPVSESSKLHISHCSGPEKQSLQLVSLAWQSVNNMQRCLSG